MSVFRQWLSRSGHGARSSTVYPSGTVISTVSCSVAVTTTVAVIGIAISITIIISESALPYAAIGGGALSDALPARLLSCLPRRLQQRHLPTEPTAALSAALFT